MEKKLLLTLSCEMQIHILQDDFICEMHGRICMKSVELFKSFILHEGITRVIGREVLYDRRYSFVKHFSCSIENQNADPLQCLGHHIKLFGYYIHPSVNHAGKEGTEVLNYR